MFGQALDGSPADAYDWIGAFDGDGNCAGASQIIVNNGVAYINLTIYGDDATTADLDEGITGDEPFYLLLWDESAELSFTGTVVDLMERLTAGSTPMVRPSRA